MAQVTFIDHTGVSRLVSAQSDCTLMELARMNDIPGIEANCGGMCACATCHVYIGEEFAALLPPLTDCEDPMLEFVDERRATSRLACQIEITAALDGLIVETPASQS